VGVRFSKDQENKKIFILPQADSVMIAPELRNFKISLHESELRMLSSIIL